MYAVSLLHVFSEIPRCRREGVCTSALLRQAGPAAYIVVRVRHDHGTPLIDLPITRNIFVASSH